MALRDYRHQIEKNTPAWDKAIRIFDKHLAGLPDDVLEQLYEIFRFDVPAGRLAASAEVEEIKKLKLEIKTLGYKIQIIQNKTGVHIFD